MKLRRILYLLVLLLSYTGSVGGDAWLIWDHLHDFHGVEHVCHHDCGACAAHHKASVRCNCLAGHGEADRLLYVASAADASHRQQHAPVAVLPPFRLQSAPDAAVLPAHTARHTQRKVPLAAAPSLLHKGLRAPPVMA
ncbi:hypothetical protein [Alistipes sp.]|uniref:hypothetical protein n=1 Tax=Alistipes sp. TaxID=1872444 RepID=UPI003A85F436